MNVSLLSNLLFQGGLTLVNDIGKSSDTVIFDHLYADICACIVHICVYLDATTIYIITGYNCVGESATDWTVSKPVVAIVHLVVTERFTVVYSHILY